MPLIHPVISRRMKSISSRCWQLLFVPRAIALALIGLLAIFSGGLPREAFLSGSVAFATEPPPVAVENILVTSLEDDPTYSNPAHVCPDPDGLRGSVYRCTLRQAVTRDHRRIRFGVSGTILLTQMLYVNSTNITIDGSTAPNGGIQLRTHPDSSLAGGLVVCDARDVVISHISVRPGIWNLPTDGIEVRNSSNVLLDHISCQWGSDECISIDGNPGWNETSCLGGHLSPAQKAERLPTM